MRTACDLIATGTDTDKAAQAAGTTAKTLRQWAADDAELGALYARARIASAGALEDEAIRAARSSTAESYGADRVLIDTLKWAAAKRYPKEYSDKASVERTVNIGSLHLEALQAPRTTVRTSISSGQPVEIAQPDTPQHVSNVSELDTACGDVEQVAD